MSTRFVKGKSRTESPRLKDLSLTAPDRNPSEGRTNNGRFTAGNRIGLGQGYKATIRKSLGSLQTSTPEAEEVVRNATSLYLANLRSLPSDGPTVRQLAAAQARHAAVATFYSNAAAQAGLATPEGMKLADAALRHDVAAQRLSVCAYDRAVREATSRPTSNKVPWILEDGEDNTPDMKRD